MSKSTRGGYFRQQERVWGTLLAAYCSCLIISNVLAAKVFILGGVMLPCAVIIFPVVYILNDMMAELFPLKRVHTGIWMAFLLNALAVLLYQIAIRLPGPDVAFAQVLGSSGRILVASFLAYLVGSNMNAWVMYQHRQRNGSRKLFTRCISSTIVGEFLDAVIFIGVAFAGSMPLRDLCIMILSQATFKVVYEIVVFPLTNLIIKKTKLYIGGVADVY